MSKHKDTTTKPFFATTMHDMGGNTGHTPENEIAWDTLDDHTKAPPSFSK